MSEPPTEDARFVGDLNLAVVSMRELVSVFSGSVNIGAAILYDVFEGNLCPEPVHGMNPTRLRDALAAAHEMAELTMNGWKPFRTVALASMWVLAPFLVATGAEGTDGVRRESM